VDPKSLTGPAGPRQYMEAVIVKYRNFDLEAFDYKTTSSAERFRVRVISSPVGEQRQLEAETVSLPSELRGRLLRLERRGLVLSEMIALGESLAGALFPPRVRIFFERSRERLEEDEGLRVRLKLDTYALADLPWEYAYLPRPGTPASQKGPDGFLVLDRSISLVRYEVLGQAPSSLDPVGAGPLRLVALLASPDVPGLAKLDLAAEQRNITQALTGLANMRAEFYPNATIDTLLDALVREAHVFHFGGHGKFEGDLGTTYGSIEGKGYLLLVDENGREKRLSAEKLALNLRGRGVRLALLGACEAGRRDGVNAWTGIVPSLTKAGIPAVVGMQYTVRDANAIAFSRQFYRALAAGQSIDAAMTDGRLAVFNRGDDSERDWGVPVLYLRAEEGIVFPQVGAAPSAQAQPGPRVVSTDPPNGAANISRRLTAIKITFDRDMQPDSHGMLSGPQGFFGLVNARVEYDKGSRTFTITRDNAGEPLPPNTSIYFSLNPPGYSGYFLDAAGTRAEMTSFGFTTGSDLNAPTTQPRPQTPDALVDRRALREAMIQAFSIEDLQELCSDIQADLAFIGISLPVSLEMVGGGSKSAQVLNLIQYLDRRGYLPYLVKSVRTARPGII
jgi:hypothetical protein